MVTIKQKSVTVALEDGPTVTVRRMAWKPAKLFLREIAAILATTMARPAAASGQPETSALQSLSQNLPELVAQSETIIEHLLAHSTDLKPEAIEQLDAGFVAELINQALACNFDDELKNSLAGIVGAVAGGLPAKPTATTS